MASNNPWDNEDDHGFNFNDELQKFLRDFLSGSGTENLNFLSGSVGDAAGFPVDPTALGQIFSMFQTASTGSDDAKIDWSVAKKTALDVVKKRKKPDTVPDANHIFGTASIWLDEATDIGSSAVVPKEISPVEWVQATIDMWIQLAEPVADGISKVLIETFETQVPEDFRAQLGNMSGMLTKIGGVMFATQLGQVVGKLASEVISGGDIGIPVVTRETFTGGTLVIENIANFISGISQPETEALLFLATRELAYSRLFKHSRWLQSHINAIINEYAAGIEISTSHFEDIANDFDPQDPSKLQELMKNGALIPPKTERQVAAHERLETLIALIDGWVDAVTSDATHRLPGSDAIAEMMRRRRATGGPSEKAFANLIGLEMRPRKLREAAKMWQIVAEKTSTQKRDSLWGHPDLLPSKQEIENPELLVARLEGKNIIDEETGINFDEELAKLLDANSSGDGTGNNKDSGDDNIADDHEQSEE